VKEEKTRGNCGNHNPRTAEMAATAPTPAPNQLYYRALGFHGRTSGRGLTIRGRGHRGRSGAVAAEGVRGQGGRCVCKNARGAGEPGGCHGARISTTDQGTTGHPGGGGRGPSPFTFQKRGGSGSPAICNPGLVCLIVFLVSPATDSGMFETGFPDCIHRVAI